MIGRQRLRVIHLMCDGLVFQSHVHCHMNDRETMSSISQFSNFTSGEPIRHHVLFM